MCILRSASYLIFIFLLQLSLISQSAHSDSRRTIATNFIKLFKDNNPFAKVFDHHSFVRYDFVDGDSNRLRLRFQNSSTDSGPQLSVEFTRPRDSRFTTDIGSYDFHSARTYLNSDSRRFFNSSEVKPLNLEDALKDDFNLQRLTITVYLDGDIILSSSGSTLRIRLAKLDLAKGDKIRLAHAYFDQVSDTLKFKFTIQKPNGTKLDLHYLLLSDNSGGQEPFKLFFDKSPVSTSPF